MVATRWNATTENIENVPLNPYGSKIPKNPTGKFLAYELGGTGLGIGLG